MNTMYLLHLILILIQYSYAARLTWELIHSGQSGAPPARRDHALGYSNKYKSIVLFGGRASSSFGDTWIYDTTNNSWREVITTTNPQTRFSVVSDLPNIPDTAEDGENFYVATGQFGSIFYNDIWRFNLSSETWQQLPQGGAMESTRLTTHTPRVPEARYGSAGGFQKTSQTSVGRFFISLGFAGERFANTYFYDLWSMSWYLADETNHNSYNPNYPHARCLHSGTVMGGLMGDLIIFGGCLSGGSTGGPCPSGDSWRFNTESMEWTQIEHCATPSTYSTMSKLPNGNVILYGGAETTKQVIETFESPADQVAVSGGGPWTLQTTAGSSIPGKRDGAIMTPAGEKGVYMFGGSGPSNELWLLRFNSSEAVEISAECGGRFINFILLHGLFMVVGWGVLLQAGAFIARYCRCYDPLWFHLHRICQVVGLLLSIAGFGFAIQSVMFDHFKFAHAIIGLVIMILAIQQPINGACRPHKPSDEAKSKKRLIWEIFHINIGRITLLLALANITLGLLLAMASQPVRIAWYAYLGALVLAYIIAEIIKIMKSKKSRRFEVK